MSGLAWANRFATAAFALRAEPCFASRRFALQSAFAVLLAGCANYTPPTRECEYIHHSIFTMNTFRYVEETVFVDGPNVCRNVIDTEGWERALCHKGADAVICRDLQRDSRSKPDRATTVKQGVVHESGGAVRQSHNTSSSHTKPGREG